jgi:HlyD family secretion protein
MDDMNPTSRDDLRQLLGAAQPSGAHLLRWSAALALLLATGAAVFLLARGPAGPPVRYQTEPATLGELVVTATATGTLQPTKSVDVGSELSGTVATVLAEENEVVKRGQLLAELDTARLRDAVIKSEAAVRAADGQVAQARATVAEAGAMLGRLRRLSETSGGVEPARHDLEIAEAALLRAQANGATARAQEAQARAALKTDQTNLTKAQIRSPVDGVVLTRKVEPGNTVVAAMNTPVLFVVAEDLTRMELQVKVDEADVASVKPGQHADFTVSAWPGRKFPATIERVGLGSTITDNVVTYKTILQVENRDLALRPGMTATAAIVTARRGRALLVPNAALRFTPPGATAAASTGSFVSRLLPRPPQAPRRNTREAADGQRQVWVLDAGGPRALALRTGVSNGRHTEVLQGALEPGMAVITDYQEAADGR